MLKTTDEQQNSMLKTTDGQQCELPFATNNLKEKKDNKNDMKRKKIIRKQSVPSSKKKTSTTRRNNIVFKSKFLVVGALGITFLFTIVTSNIIKYAILLPAGKNKTSSTFRIALACQILDTLALTIDGVLYICLERGIRKYIIKILFMSISYEQDVFFDRDWCVDFDV